MIYLTEFVKRFLQWVVGSGLFDFPPFFQLRNIVYRSMFLTGRGFTVGRSCQFIRADFTLLPVPTGKLSIGNNVAINHCVEIDYSGGVTIQDDVWFGRNVLVETHRHICAQAPKSQWKISRSPLVIERGAWIGVNAVIMDSVRVIGEGAIVGAGSIVMSDVPAGTTVLGAPARVIMERT